MKRVVEKSRNIRDLDEFYCFSVLLGATSKEANPVIYIQNIGK